jgi:replicative DNA helicase
MLIREHVPPEVQFKYQELYHKYSQIPVSAGKFRWCLKRFQEQKEEAQHVKILNDVFTIQQSGLTVGKGRDKRELKGYKDARAYMAKKLAEMDLKISESDVTEGDIREEADAYISEYQDRKNEPAKFVGVKTGLDPVDDLTNGAQPGELWVFGGYTEVGKTFNIINSAHHTCTKQAKNVVLATGEVVYPQFRRRFYHRHARNAQFGLPFGIDSDAYKKAQLTAQEEQFIAKAMQDLKTNPNYGRVYLFQIPKGADLTFIHTKLNYINSLWRVDAFYLDSLNLLIKGEGNQVRIQANQLIKDCKQMAVNFDHQRGIPIFTPWHANRSSWEKAKEKGYYDLNSWMEADELERSADMLMWLLKLENAQETREIQAGICKYRDGKNLKQFTLYHDFASSYIGTVASGGARPNGQVTAATAMSAPSTPTVAQTNEDRAADLF